MKNVPTKVDGNLYLTSDFNLGVNDVLKAFITDSGQAFDDMDNTQLVQAVYRMIMNRSTFKEADTSTGSAYDLTLIYEPITAPIPLSIATGIDLQAGTKLSFIATNANTITAPTLKFSASPSIPTHTIVRKDGSPLEVGAINVDDVVDVLYDGTHWILVSTNEQNSIRDVNESNYYTVTGITGSTVYDLVASNGENPVQYYNGMLIGFIATIANTGNVSVNVNGIGAVDVIDITGMSLIAGELTAGDLIVAMYHANQFKVIKKTSQFTVNSDDLATVRSNTDGDFYPFFNPLPVHDYPTATPISITKLDDKRVVYALGNTLITLPLRSTIPATFSCKIMLTDGLATSTTIQASGSDTLLRDNILGATVTIQNPVKSNVIIDVYAIDSNSYLIYGVSGATETESGVARYATLAEVNAGTDQTSIITPYTLQHKSIGLVDLGEILSVGAFWFHRDKDAIPPGIPIYTWVPIYSDASGHRAVNMIVANAALPQVTPNLVIGNTGAYPIGANECTTDGFTLGIPHIPNHPHEVLSVNIDNTGSWFRTTDYTGISDQGKAGHTTTSSVGGNQAHPHDISMTSIAMYGWLRTA